MRILWFCLLLASAIAPALAQSPSSPPPQSPNDYAGRWPLQLPAGAAAGVFEPGPDLYPLLQDPAFGDLQVFDATGAAMPMARASQDGAPRWVAASFASAGPADGAAGDAGVMGYVYRLRADVAASAARIGFGSTATNVALQYQGDGRWQAAARMPAGAAAAQDPTGTTPPGEVAFAAPIAAHGWRIISGRALSPSPTLRLSVRPARFVFLAQGTPPFLLAVGHPTLRRAPASIDVELAGLRTAHGEGWQPAQATLGTQATTPFAATVAPVEATMDWQRWLPWAGGGAGLLLLAWFLAGRRRQRCNA